MSRNTLEPMHVFIAVASIIATMVFQFLTDSSINPCHNYAKDCALLAVISLFLAMSLSIADHLKSSSNHNYSRIPRLLIVKYYNLFIFSIYIISIQICWESWY